MVFTTVFPGTALLVAIVALYALYRQFTKPKPTGSLPPGPKPLPILGNIADLSAKELWLLAERWAKLYGPITYLHVVGQGLVFLSTSDVVLDLLDKRGAIYSDKPHFVMAGELCGCENMMGFTPYGDQSRRQRKVVQVAFGPASIKQYYPWLELETRPFLRWLLEDPMKFQDHLRRYAGSLTLSVVYGYHVKSADDPFLKLGEECISLLANQIAPGIGIWPVDIFPTLKHLPDWFPGAGFKRNAAIWKKRIEKFVDEPFAFVLNERCKGTAKPSFVSSVLDRIEDKDKGIDAQHDVDLRWTANAMYIGSIDSTTTTITHFILAMIQYPSILKRAQAEIDQVIGKNRLPIFEDRISLPYCNAVFTETLRWSAPVPLSLPHRLMEDDIYEGMLIPKGSLVFANIWTILRDESLFPNPHTFDPNRYLVPDIDEVMERRKDPRTYIFGFGRRRCPGVHLVECSAWLLVVSMIATLDFDKGLDEYGKEIEPELVFDNPIFRTPVPFKLAVRARSQAALQLLTEEMVSM